MLFDYTVADGQAQTRAAAIGFGGEKRVENPVNMLAGDASAGIGHFNFHAAIVGGGADFQHAAGRHGVASVQKQIQENLLELVGRTAHRGQRIAQLLDDVNLGGLERMGNQRKGFLDHPIDIDIGQLSGTGTREIEEVVDDFAGAKGLLDDFFDDAVARIIAGHLLGQHLNVIGNDRQRSIDFVSHAGGKQAEGGQLLGLRHLLFHALALGDIVKEEEPADAFASFADQRGDGDVEREELALVMEALLIDAGDLLFIAAGSDFDSELFGQQRAQLTAHSILTLHIKELLHASVPGFDHAPKVNGQHTDVQRFDDILAEILKPRDFEGFLLERRIQLGIVERDGHVAGDGLHQFDVVAGEEIAIYSLAQAEDGDGVLANAAGDKVVQVQLFESLADGIGNVSRRAGRLEEERPPSELGPGRLEEAEIHGFGETHAHGASEAHAGRAQGIFHEDGDAVDQQGLRETVHDRAEHGVEANFVGERTTELDQGAAVIEAVAVEKPVKAGLDPFAEGLKEESGDHDGNHAAGRPGGLRMKDIGDEGDQGEVNGSNGGGGGGIGQAALEDDIHVHQPVADDGVAEAQRNKHEAEYGGAHPRTVGGIHHVGHDIEEREGQTSGEGPTGQPLQLLPQNAGRRFPKVAIEHDSGGQEIETEIAELDFIEQQARAEPGNKAEDVESGADVEEKETCAGAINQGELGKGTDTAFGPLRKNQSEMEKQGGSEKTGYDAGPIYLVVESVQFAGVLEGIKDERDQAENIKVDGARSIPAANKNEKAYEKIEESDEAPIILDGSGLLGGSGDNGRFKFAAVAGELVAHLGPQPVVP